MRRWFGMGGADKAKKIRRPRIIYGPNFISVAPDDMDLMFNETSQKLLDLWNRVVRERK